MGDGERQSAAVRWRRLVQEIEMGFSGMGAVTGLCSGGATSYHFISLSLALSWGISSSSTLVLGEGEGERERDIQVGVVTCSSELLL